MGTHLVGMRGDLDSFRPIQRGHAYIGKVPVNGVFLAASTAATLRSHSINAKRLLVLSLTSWWKDVELHKELWTPSGSQAGVLLLTESTVPCGRVDRSSSKHAPWELRLGCPHYWATFLFSPWRYRAVGTGTGKRSRFVGRLQRCRMVRYGWSDAGGRRLHGARILRWPDLGIAWTLGAGSVEDTNSPKPKSRSRRNTSVTLTLMGLRTSRLSDGCSGRLSLPCFIASCVGRYRSQAWHVLRGEYGIRRKVPEQSDPAGRHFRCGCDVASESFLGRGVVRPTCLEFW